MPNKEIFLESIYEKSVNCHYVKRIRIRSCSGPHFPAFEPDESRIRTFFTQ